MGQGVVGLPAGKVLQPIPHIQKEGNGGGGGDISGEVCNQEGSSIQCVGAEGLATEHRQQTLLDSGHDGTK